MKLYLLIAAVFLSNYLSAQNNETANWYFGDFAGLNFQENNISPQILLNGTMLTPSGSAVISDLDGNLLFYTEGDKVWNNNHMVMDNGTLVNLTPGDVGNNANYQTYKNVQQNSIIIPITDTEGLYYIFTIGRSHQDMVAPVGLYLSKIDMTQNNGLGKVIEKNIQIIGSEREIGKLSAVHHADGKSIWIMTTLKESDSQYTSFYAYKINMDGSIEDPIISFNELYFKGVPEGNLKFSPDGTKIACNNYKPTDIDDHLFVFDFDNQIGIVTNKRKLLTSFVFFEVASVHGIEFSNDSQYLYASIIREGSLSPGTPNVNPNPKSLLYQYNLADLSPQTYATTLHEEEGATYGGALQLSNNGKIYRALPENNSLGTDFLGVISNPNLFGIESNYLHNEVNLSNRKSRRGLPNFIQSYFRTRILTTEGCKEDPILFEVDTYAEITEAEWDFGDGNISNEINPNYTYNTSGSYDVSVTITINNRQIITSKRIFVNEKPILNSNEELIQCDNDTDGISIFNLFNIKDKITNPDLDEELIFYNTLNDAEEDINRISNPETYTNTIPDQEIYVRVINKKGCSSITSFMLRTVLMQPIILSDIVVCDSSNHISGDSIGFFNIIDVINNVNNQLNLSSSNSITVHSTFTEAQTKQNSLRSIESASTTVWIRIEDENLNCGGIGSINLIVNPEPLIDLEDTYTLCGEEPVSISGISSNYRFEWLDNNNNVISESRYFNTTEEGIYTHFAYIYENGLECSISKEFIINRVEEPTFNSIDIIEGANINTVEVNLNGNSSYEFSIDGINFFGNSINYIFNNVPFGAYTIYARDINNCEPAISEDIFLIGYPSFFTPNDDGVNDFWSIKGLNFELYESIKIFNRYGKFIADLNVYNAYRWDGKYNGVKLPVSDYWFEVKFKNGEKKVGNFTLKR